jgi:hypothetical protein
MASHARIVPAIAWMVGLLLVAAATLASARGAEDYEPVDSKTICEWRLLHCSDGAAGATAPRPPTRVPVHSLNAASPVCLPARACVCVLRACVCYRLPGEAGWLGVEVLRAHFYQRLRLDLVS